MLNKCHSDGTTHCQLLQSDLTSISLVHLPWGPYFLQYKLIDEDARIREVC